MMFNYGNHMGGWSGAFMGVGMVLFWGLVIAGIVVLVRHLATYDAQGAPPRRPTAEELLAERFARGDVDEQEYRQRLDTLRSGASSARMRQ